MHAARVLALSIMQTHEQYVSRTRRKSRRSWLDWPMTARWVTLTRSASDWTYWLWSLQSSRQQSAPSTDHSQAVARWQWTLPPGWWQGWTPCSRRWSDIARRIRRTHCSTRDGFNQLTVNINKCTNIKNSHMVTKCNDRIYRQHTKFAQLFIHYNNQASNQIFTIWYIYYN